MNCCRAILVGVFLASLPVLSLLFLHDPLVMFYMTAGIPVAMLVLFMVSSIIVSRLPRATPQRRCSRRESRNTSIEKNRRLSELLGVVGEYLRTALRLLRSWLLWIRAGCGVSFSSRSHVYASRTIERTADESKGWIYTLTKSVSSVWQRVIMRVGVVESDRAVRLSPTSSNDGLGGSTEPEDPNRSRVPDEPLLCDRSPASTVTTPGDGSSLNQPSPRFSPCESSPVAPLEGESPGSREVGGSRSGNGEPLTAFSPISHSEDDSEYVVRAESDSLHEQGNDGDTASDDGERSECGGVVLQQSGGDPPDRAADEPPAQPVHGRERDAETAHGQEAQEEPSPPPPRGPSDGAAERGGLSSRDAERAAEEERSNALESSSTASPRSSSSRSTSEGGRLQSRKRIANVLKKTALLRFLTPRSKKKSQQRR